MQCARRNVLACVTRAAVAQPTVWQGATASPNARKNDATAIHESDPTTTLIISNFFAENTSCVVAYQCAHIGTRKMYMETTYIAYYAKMWCTSSKHFTMRYNGNLLPGTSPKNKNSCKSLYVITVLTSLGRIPHIMNMHSRNATHVHLRVHALHSTPACIIDSVTKYGYV